VKKYIGIAWWLVLACVLLSPIAAAAAPQDDDYEVGGPLAGLKLPPYPTQHGEQPGYPGCIPELMGQGKTINDMGREFREWGPQGMPPERHLYDGSVEHWRAYMFKYMPIRSFFDRQSQLKNFVAPNIPGAAPGQVEQYVEPVYWVPRHDPPRPTGRTNKPVPVIRMKLGQPVLRLELGELDEGLYVVRVTGPWRRPGSGPSGCRCTCG